MWERTVPRVFCLGWSHVDGTAQDSSAQNG